MKISYGNTTIDMEAGAGVLQCLFALGAPTEGVLAVQQGGRVLEMGDAVMWNGEMKPLTLADEEGRRIYERGLRFVALLAIRRLMPGQRVRIEYSVGGGVCLMLLGHETTAEECDAIRREMAAIIAEDLVFDKREWSLDDAIAYFGEDGQPDKVALLKRRTVPFFNLYECGGMQEYFYGVMPPSTGALKVFGVCHMPGRGLALLMPDPEDTTRADNYIDRPKHLKVFDQSAAWCAILGVKNAPDLDALVEQKQLRAFIRVNEALHGKAIDAIAEEIARRKRQIIMIAGPSSSGKTTTTGRLAIALRVLGYQPAMISLDDYYINREDLPVEPDGTVDLEGLHTIDVPLFREHMIRLLKGETVEIPRYSFKTGP